MIKSNKDKRTNSDLQNTTQKTKDRATRTPLSTAGVLTNSGRVSSSCSVLITPAVLLLVQTKPIRDHLQQIFRNFPRDDYNLTTMNP